MRKVLVCALVLGGFAASARAADLDLDSVKDPLPDTLTYKGVTIYGTIDVGYAYQTNGVPLNGSFPAGLEYNALTTSRNLTGKSISTLAENGLSQSTIGVKVEESVGMGFVAIGKLDTGFEPLSGEIADACKAMMQNVPFAATPAQQTANGDYSRCGQAINGEAYAGLSNSAYGTLTIGRQNSIQLDGFAAYDPMSLAYAFSVFGYTGSLGGAGSTEAARWDNAVKYLYQYGPVHASVMYSDGGDDTGILGAAWGADVGFNYRGLSIDANYAKIDGAVNLLNVAKDAGSSTLKAFASDDEAVNIMGKYTFEFSGGFKDDAPGSKLTLFAGYSHNVKGNSTDTGSTAQGGYPITIVKGFLGTDQVLQSEWAGAKYETGPWSFTAAYYHIDQNNFSIGAPVAGNGPCVKGGSSLLQCAGDLNQGSFLIDYAFNKHFDVYGGINYSVVDDGFAAGFLGVPNTGASASVDQTTVMTGMRLKF